MKKETIFKNIIFLLFFIIVNAYLNNMLKYFLVYFEELSEMLKAVFYYNIILTLLISTFTILISITVFKVSINYTLLLAWLNATYSIRIVYNINSAYEGLELRILTVCIINLLSSVLMYFVLKDKQTKELKSKS
jgi:hypothetical protein